MVLLAGMFQFCVVLSAKLENQVCNYLFHSKIALFLFLFLLKFLTDGIN